MKPLVLLQTQFESRERFMLMATLCLLYQSQLQENDQKRTIMSGLLFIYRKTVKEALQEEIEALAF